MRTAVFLDRDGVIIENRPDHVKTWSEVRFLPDVFQPLNKLAQSPLAIVIISNQGAVGRGLMTLETAWDIQSRIVAEIEEHGGRIDASYICPHHPDDGCDCRKPAPGLILQASRELSLNLPASWLVGDAVTDLQAGAAARMRAVLVRTGRGEHQEQHLLAEASLSFPVVADLTAAINYILEHIMESHR